MRRESDFKKMAGWAELKGSTGRVVAWAKKARPEERRLPFAATCARDTERVFIDSAQWYTRALAIIHLHGSATALPRRAPPLFALPTAAQWPAQARRDGRAAFTSAAPTHRAFFFCVRVAQVCLSAAIMTKQGKVLLARQFVEMTRMKVSARDGRAPRCRCCCCCCWPCPSPRAALRCLQRARKKSGGDQNSVPCRCGSVSAVAAAALAACGCCSAWLLGTTTSSPLTHVCLPPLPPSLLHNWSRTIWRPSSHRYRAPAQHSETAEVRYVYQPIESLILVLTTSKLSNIVEDLETLRLFSKLIPEYCPGEVDETSVCKHAFELLFAFDELIACGVGHRENLTLQQVQANLEMESHEEKLATAIRRPRSERCSRRPRGGARIARDNRSRASAAAALRAACPRCATSPRPAGRRPPATIERTAPARPSPGPTSNSRQAARA